MSALFEPYTLRSLTVPNRVWMSPMCQYCAEPTGPDAGTAGDWHLAHYGVRAAGGTGLVMVEATAVSPEGRITPGDLGLWNDRQVRALRRITGFVKERGAVAGVQLAHAGRKASTDAPWRGGAPLDAGHGGWRPAAPSALPFAEGHPVPREMTLEEIDDLVGRFADAARRALAAGFEVVEVHGAHGYLIHEFLSPLSNRRTDAYGGSFENRTRLALRIVDAVREVWPADLPLFFRVSATDWTEGGWSPEETVRLAALLRERGVDLLDVSSGGAVPGARIPVGPGYQVPLAARVRAEAGLPVAAVGLITEPEQAEKTVANGEADAVFLGRELLRDPHWALRAARVLGAGSIRLPDQYAWAL